MFEPVGVRNAETSPGFLREPVYIDRTTDHLRTARLDLFTMTGTYRKRSSQNTAAKNCFRFPIQELQSTHSLCVGLGLCLKMGCLDIQISRFPVCILTLRFGLAFGCEVARGVDEGTRTKLSAAARTRDKTMWSKGSNMSHEISSSCVKVDKQKLF